MTAVAWWQRAREKQLPTSVVGGVPLEPKPVVVKQEPPARKRAA